MLQSILYNRRQDLEIYLRDFDFHRSTWVVSDLKSKYELQKILLKRDGFFLDQSVVRASDLWKHFFRYAFPEYKIVSKSFYQILLQNFLHQFQAELQVNELASKTVLLYINQLISLLHHPQGETLIEEWFVKNPNAAAEWKTWYLVARAAHSFLFNKKKVILAEHLASLLQNELNLTKYWTRSLWVDLGVEITGVEADLFQNLSRANDVHVFVPHPKHKSQFPFLMKPYERIISFAQETKDYCQKGDAKPQVEVKRFSSMLGEVKFLATEVRRLIEVEKIEPEKIAIMSANIENYWPSVRAIFDFEGIPCNKSVVASFQMLPVFQAWMSRIKLRQNNISTENLEQVLFAEEEPTRMSFDQFNFLFGKIYDREDLGRDLQIAKLFSNDYDDFEMLNQSKFIAYALKFWSSETHAEELITLLKELISTSTNTSDLKMKEWVSYLESLISQKEIKLREASQLGVQICSIMSSQSQVAEFKFFLGLSDEMLASRSKSLISGRDVLKLYSECDIEISSFEESFYEWEIRWSLESSGQKHYLLLPLAHFDGSLQAPSKIFLETEMFLAKEDHQLHTEQRTRLDSLQSQFPPPEMSDVLKRKFESEFSLTKWQNLKWDWQNVSLSASQLENYLKCPFIFAAEKVFGAREEDSIDIDVSPKSKGTLIHALFKKLLEESEPFEASSDSILKFIDELKENSIELKYIENEIWQVQRQRYARIAEKFLNLERAWAKEFSKMKPVALEKDFQFYFDMKTGKISKEPSEFTFLFRGKMDRVDASAKNEIIIIDYKSSAHQAKDFGQWFEHGQLQLLLYMWAIENEALEGFAKSPQVLGTFYYVFKNFRRDYGMQLDGYAGLYFAETKRRNLTATAAEKAALLQALENLLQQQLELIQKGVFLANPRDRDTCKTCRWKGLCRAPHLH